MANVLTVVWFVIAYVVMNASLLVWAGLMLPGPVDRARQRVEAKPVGSFFVGLIFAVVSLFLGAAMLQGKNPGPVQLLGWILMGPWLASSIVGGAAVASILAERIARQMKNDSRILALVGGALCTTLSSVLPVIGWFVFLPVVGLIGTGAGVMGILSKREVRRKAVVEAPVVEPAAQSAPEFVLTHTPASGPMAQA